MPDLNLREKLQSKEASVHCSRSAPDVKLEEVQSADGKHVVQVKRRGGHHQLQIISEPGVGSESSVSIASSEALIHLSGDDEEGFEETTADEVEKKPAEVPVNSVVTDEAVKGASSPRAPNSTPAVEAGRNSVYSTKRAAINTAILNTLEDVIKQIKESKSQETLGDFSAAEHNDLVESLWQKTTTIVDLQRKLLDIKDDVELKDRMIESLSTNLSVS